MSTIKDIAKLCYVSVSTVSRALNGAPDINTETKELILKTAKELDYIPNKNARQLVKGKNNHLAIITRTLDEENLFHILRGLYNFSESINYEVSLHTFGTSIKQGKSYYQYCKGNNIEGVLLYGIHTNDPYIDELITKKFPTVIVDCDISGEKVVNITINNYEASYKAVTHLIEAGCKNIISIQGGEGSFVTKERVRGYKKSLKDNNIKGAKIYCGDFTEKTAEALCEIALKENQKIDGIFCGSDNIAVGVYKALKNNEKKIGKDVSIIGFGDLEICKYLNPALSTVRQSMYEFGYRGGETLYKLINNNLEDNLIELDYEIVLRDSVRKQ